MRVRGVFTAYAGLYVLCIYIYTSNEHMKTLQHQWISGSPGLVSLQRGSDQSNLPDMWSLTHLQYFCTSCVSWQRERTQNILTHIFSQYTLGINQPYCHVFDTGRLIDLDSILRWVIKPLQRLRFDVLRNFINFPLNWGTCAILLAAAFSNSSRHMSLAAGWINSSAMVKGFFSLSNGPSHQVRRSRSSKY